MREKQLPGNAVRPAEGRRRLKRDLDRLRRDGTLYIVSGTLVASVATYVFQVLGARALGVVAFAPVAALLTVQMFAFNVALVPIEQYTIRRVALGLPADRLPPLALIGGSAILAGLFVHSTRSDFFAGASIYIALAVLSVVTHALFQLRRGDLAGQRAFRTYGLLSGTASLVRLALGAGFLLVAVSGPAVGWAVVLAPLVAIGFRPQRVRIPQAEAWPRDSARRLLTGFVISAAAAQTLIFAVPLAAGAIGGTVELVSVVFVTVQLARVAMVLVRDLGARLLPSFTRLAAESQHQELTEWAIRFGTGGVVVAPIAGLIGWLAGPALVAVFFGSEYRPSPELAGAVATGMVLATLTMFAGQIAVARAHTFRLAAASLLGLGAAAIVLAASKLAPEPRVGLAFLIGEIVSLGLVIAAGWRRAPGAETKD